MKKTKSPSNYLLIALALFSILVYALVENTRAPVKQPHYRQKVEAAKLAELAQRTLKDRVVELNLPIDPENDPGQTGLIGEQYTLITTDTGILSAKLASTNVDFAAAFIDMFHNAGVSKGDLIAVAQTGSFPAINTSLYAAMKVMELHPVIITSAGPSSWGATNPELTWLDMERYLYEKGIFHFRSTAVSLGGGGDRGRGLSPRGRKLLMEAIERNQKIEGSDHDIEFIHTNSLRSSIERRMEIYLEAEKSQNKPLKAYVNVGGGIASLGSTQNGRLIRAGLTPDLTDATFPAEGVITLMAERGLPIIHMLSIKRIARDYQISITPYVNDENNEVGQGSLYYREQYSLWFTIVATVLLMITIVVMLRLDVKHYLFHRKRKSTT